MPLFTTAAASRDRGSPHLPRRPGRRQTRASAALFGAGRQARWRRAVLRRVIAVLAAAAALAVGAHALRPEPLASRPALVAAHDLPGGHRLTAADLRAVTVPADLPGGDRLATEDHLIGRSVATTLSAGELLTSTRLVPRGPTEGLPAGSAALHVVVSDVRMLDLIATGQRVRVHRARTGELVAEEALVVGVDEPDATSSLLGGGSDSERGLVLALPSEVVNAALTTPEPDGLVPRMHVVPTSR